jgi:hypothetical protein
LRRDVDRLFFQGVFVTNHIEERKEYMKTSAERPAVFPQTLDDKSTLLRNYDGSLGDDENHQKRQNDDNDKSAHNGLRF